MNAATSGAFKSQPPPRATMVGRCRESGGRSPRRPMLFFEESHDKQENHGADERVENLGSNAADDDKSDARQQPAGNQGSDDPDNDIAQQSKAVAFHEQARQPARNPADDQPYDDRHDHDV